MFPDHLSQHKKGYDKDPHKPQKSGHKIATGDLNGIRTSDGSGRNYGPRYNAATAHCYGKKLAQCSESTQIQIGRGT